MNLSRRSFLKGLAATAGALVLPPTLTDNAEAARRFWALDRTMVGPPKWQMFGPYDASHLVTATEYRSVFAQWVEAYEPRETWFVNTIRLSDPSLGIPAGQAGGRPPSPYLNDTLGIVLPGDDDYNPFISTKLRTA